MAGVPLESMMPVARLLDPNPFTNPVPGAAQAQAPIWDQAAQQPIDVAKAWYDWRTSLPPMSNADAAMGVTPMGLAGALERGGIRAFHGSPHSFDRFDLGKIGTGEGAQAYGHGLYFAGNEDVARDYKSTLSRRNIDVTLDGKPITDWAPTVDGMEGQDWRVSKLLGDYGRTGGPLPDFVQRQQDWYRGDKPMEDALARFSQRVQSTWTPGHMYEVNIAAEPHQLLDWDKPLNEQGPQIRQFATNEGYAQAGQLDPRETGQSMHRSLVEGGDPDVIASLLHERGIPGIQYLDQGSRAAGDGTRNYVIFNPDLISILRKYGIVPPIAGAGLAGAIAGPQNQPQQ